MENLLKEVWSLHLLHILMKPLSNAYRAFQQRKLVKIKKQWPLRKSLMRKHKKQLRLLSYFFRKLLKTKCIGQEIL